ncbi:Brevis radix [Sesbania bispinosa]|nr:Brevis radix [Sesbania bispinosa]
MVGGEQGMDRRRLPVKCCFPQDQVDGVRSCWNVTKGSNTSQVVTFNHYPILLPPLLCTFLIKHLEDADKHTEVLPDGTKELRRVRFSRQMFDEEGAKQWLEENREWIEEDYL